LRTRILDTARLDRELVRLPDIITISVYPAGLVTRIVKFSLEQARVLPPGGAASHDVTVTGPRILLKVGYGSYDFRTDGVEMDIPHNITEIPVLAYYG